eukprot:355645-Chlamydomonas_euryale.AAC.13
MNNASNNAQALSSKLVSSCTSVPRPCVWLHVLHACRFMMQPWSKTQCLFQQLSERGRSLPSGTCGEEYELRGTAFARYIDRAERHEMHLQHRAQIMRYTCILVCRPRWKLVATGLVDPRKPHAMYMLGF